MGTRPVVALDVGLFRLHEFEEWSAGRVDAGDQVGTDDVVDVVR